MDNGNEGGHEGRESQKGQASNPLQITALWPLSTPRETLCVDNTMLLWKKKAMPGKGAHQREELSAYFKAE